MTSSRGGGAPKGGRLPVKKTREVKKEEEGEVMLGGRVVNCSIFAGNLNAN